MDHLRRLLLPEITAQAANRRQARDLRELERIALRSEAMPLEERDWRVQNLIARASGNVLFVILLNFFTRRTEEAFRLYFSDENSRARSIRFHAEVCAAIKAGDADGARRIVVDMLDYAEAFTLSMLGANKKRRRA